MDQTKNLLLEEIEALLKEISEMEPGSEARAKSLEELAKLYRLKIEETEADTKRVDSENRLKIEAEKAKDDIAYRKAQRKDATIALIVNVGLQLTLTSMGLIAYDIWQRRGFIFEKDGTVSNPFTRNVQSNMLPKIRR